MARKFQIKVDCLDGMTLKGMATMIRARARYLKEKQTEAAAAVIIEAAKAIQRVTKEAKVQ